MPEYTFPGFAGTKVEYNGVAYTLLEDPHYTFDREPQKYGYRPAEPRAMAAGPDGQEVEIYWYLTDSDDNFNPTETDISGLLEIEEE